jgi:hypothetical protein
MPGTGCDWIGRLLRVPGGGKVRPRRGRCPAGPAAGPGGSFAGWLGAFGIGFPGACSMLLMTVLATVSMPVFVRSAM